MNHELQRVSARILHQILELLNHPFLLRLYATFQDRDGVFFLTELLDGGELWSIMYEATSGFDSGKTFARREAR